MYKKIMLLGTVLIVGQHMNCLAPFKRPVALVGITATGITGTILHSELRYRTAVAQLKAEKVSQDLLIRSKFHPHGLQLNSVPLSSWHSRCAVCHLSATAQRYYPFAVISRAYNSLKESS